MDTDTSVPTIEALNNSFPGSIPDLFSHFFRIYFVKMLYIAQTDTELMLTVYNLRPEWRKEQSVQDGQVAIHDFPETFKSTWHTIFGSLHPPNL